MILVAGLLGTTFSVAGAFFQGNLVREKNWTVKDYEGSVGDAIAGVCVLTGVSMIIMITAGTVIRGQPATDIGTLALSLKPLLGSTAYWVFCVGLVAVAMNPFLINAMIGGTILADGVGARCTHERSVAARASPWSSWSWAWAWRCWPCAPAKSRST